MFCTLLLSSRCLSSRRKTAASISVCFCESIVKALVKIDTSGLIDILAPCLLVGMVGRTHQWSGCRMLEANGIGVVGIFSKFVRVDKASHRQVVFRGGEVLADCKHVDIVAAQIV